MLRASGLVVTLIAAASVLSGCAGGNAAEAEPSPAGDHSRATTGTATTGTGTAALPGATGARQSGAVHGSGGQNSAVPASAGSGKCLDLNSPVVQNAVAQLPPFRQWAWKATMGTDATLGSCLQLMWAHVDIDGGTASSPDWTLFFDRQGYLGTATDGYTSFTWTVGSTDDSVSVSYRWLNPGDTTAGVSGGPAIVTYSLRGRTVTADRSLPPQVSIGGVAPTDTATATADPTPSQVPTASPTASPTAAPVPVSHCDEATPAAFQSNAEANWGSRIAGPFTVDNIVCADDWARARIPAGENRPQNTMLLFHYTGGGWSGVEMGSGFSCTDKGAPAETAAKLGC